MIEDLIDISMKIIRGPGRDKLTAGDIKLLEMAAEGKIKTAEQRHVFLETFKDLIDMPIQAVDSAPTEPVSTELPDDKPPAKIPRPDSRPIYTIAARNIERSSTGKTDQDQLERTIFAMSLIYPENMNLITGAVEYILEHQLGDNVNDSEQLHRLSDGLNDVSRAVERLRDRAREKTLGISEKDAE